MKYSNAHRHRVSIINYEFLFFYLPYKRTATHSAQPAMSSTNAFVNYTNVLFINTTRGDFMREDQFNRFRLIKSAITSLEARDMSISPKYNNLMNELRSHIHNERKVQFETGYRMLNVIRHEKCDLHDPTKKEEYATSEYMKQLLIDYSDIEKYYNDEMEKIDMTISSKFSYIDRAIDYINEDGDQFGVVSDIEMLYTHLDEQSDDTFFNSVYNGVKNEVMRINRSMDCFRG